MKTFHCDHCQQLVFFENVRCVKCEHALAYLPDVADTEALDTIDSSRWRSPARCAQGLTYRWYENYCRENVCNRAIPDADPNPRCRSCRLTRVRPDLNHPGSREAWYCLEAAKRRLVY